MTTTYMICSGAIPSCCIVADMVPIGAITDCIAIVTIGQALVGPTVVRADIRITITTSAAARIYRMMFRILNSIIEIRRVCLPPRV